MKIVSKFKYVLLALVVVFSFSCSKEDGRDGAPGVQGIAGQDGVDGEDGNAKVVTSAWLDANWNSIDVGTRKRMRIIPTELGVSTADLRDKYVVMVYLRQCGISYVYSMPSSGRWNNALYSFSFASNIAETSGLLITLESTDNVDLTEYQYDAARGNRFRYVLIPANMGARYALELENMSYEAVVDHFSLDY